MNVGSYEIKFLINYSPAFRVWNAVTFGKEIQ